MVRVEVNLTGAVVLVVADDVAVLSAGDSYVLRRLEAVHPADLFKIRAGCGEGTSESHTANMTPSCDTLCVIVLADVLGEPIAGKRIEDMVLDAVLLGVPTEAILLDRTVGALHGELVDTNSDIVRGLTVRVCGLDGNGDAIGSLSEEDDALVVQEVHVGRDNLIALLVHVLSSDVGCLVLDILELHGHALLSGAFVDIIIARKVGELPRN